MIVKCFTQEMVPHGIFCWSGFKHTSCIGQDDHVLLVLISFYEGITDLRMSQMANQNLDFKKNLIIKKLCYNLAYLALLNFWLAFFGCWCLN